MWLLTLNITLWILCAVFFHTILPVSTHPLLSFGFANCTLFFFSFTAKEEEKKEEKKEESEESDDDMGFGLFD